MALSTRNRHPYSGPKGTGLAVLPLCVMGRHAPARLRIIVTLAALRERDTVSFTRLQEVIGIGLTSGNLITYLRKLEDAGYVATNKSVDTRSAARTDVWITNNGRAALDVHTTTLRGLIDGV